VAYILHTEFIKQQAKAQVIQFIYHLKKQSLTFLVLLTVDLTQFYLHQINMHKENYLAQKGHNNAGTYSKYNCSNTLTSLYLITASLINNNYNTN
jgi:hypothetical protein